MKEGRLFRGPAHFTPTDEFMEIVHAPAKFFFRAGATRSQNTADKDRAEKEDFVSHRFYVASGTLRPQRGM
jgi:hypothetical protein